MATARRVYSGDGGAASNALVDGPSGVTFDNRGDLLVTDLDGNVVRIVDTQGIITTVAGNGLAAFAGDGGFATNASLDGPCVTAVDPGSRLFIADGAEPSDSGG